MYVPTFYPQCIPNAGTYTSPMDPISIGKKLPSLRKLLE